MEAFRDEARRLPTEDILLILQDQVDLYTDDELRILRQELASRPDNGFEPEEEKREIKPKTEYEAISRAQREQESERRKISLEERIASLKAGGFNGYFEYTTLSLVDNGGGGLTPTQVTELLNDYALDGWRLVSAYANELGQNSTGGGFGGFSVGTNSTIDQHILILERFIRF